MMFVIQVRLTSIVSYPRLNCLIHRIGFSYLRLVYEVSCAVYGEVPTIDRFVTFNDSCNGWETDENFLTCSIQRRGNSHPLFDDSCRRSGADIDSGPLRVYR